MGEVCLLTSFDRRWNTVRITRWNRWLILLAILMLTVGALALSGTFAAEENLALEGTAETLTGQTAFDVQVVRRLADGSTHNMSTDGAMLTKDVLWCPNRTEILYLEYTNNEAFPVQISLNMNVTQNQFGDLFSYTVIPGLKADDANHPADWNAFSGSAAVTHQGVLNGSALPVLKEITLQPGETKVCALGVHMSHEASSDFANKQMSLDFVLTVNANYEPGQVPAAPVQP